MKQTFRITLLNSGESCECKEDETVLHALLRSCLKPEKQGCYGGGCGICKARVNKGDYETFKKMSRAHVAEAEEENQLVLLCCIRPKSDIEISFDKK